MLTPAAEQVRASAPFVVVNNTSTAAAAAELSGAGWLCVDGDDVDPVARCFDGYGIQVPQIGQ
jgi:hypothetical protein